MEQGDTTWVQMLGLWTFSPVEYLGLKRQNVYYIHRK